MTRKTKIMYIVLGANERNKDLLIWQLYMLTYIFTAVETLHKLEIKFTICLVC